MIITDIKEIKITCMDEELKEHLIILNDFVGLINSQIINNYDPCNYLKVKLDISLECEGYNVDFKLGEDYNNYD